MRSLFHRFFGDKRGNVAITLCIAMLPVVSIAGMSVDYTMAGRRQSQINAIADAAALSTTTPAAMALLPATAQANAVAMFNAQVASLNGVIYSAANLTVTVCPNAANPSCPVNTSLLVTRTTTVQYTAQSKNAFGALLRMATMNIGGNSKASISAAPNIDFYLLLDTSPSMGIPSTTAGINTMVANTSAQGGCAFACHESAPTPMNVKGNPGNPPEDNYALARQLGVTLRIDLIQQATANLITTAATTEALNGATYRIATYTFDQAFKTVTALTPNLATAATQAASGIQMLVVANDADLTVNPTVYNNSEDTQFDTAMANSKNIPNPGNGTNQPADTPQEVLFLVTDGVIDEAYPGYGPTLMTYSGRTLTTVGYQTDYCTPLKARGVRIAVLYTTYNPLPSNTFYNRYIEPFQPTIATALQSCASPGLFFQVNTDGDINAAMQTLFANAVATAHLTQ